MKNVYVLLITTLWLVSLVGYAQSADEKAIKSVIQSESAAFYQRNADKVVSYWLNAPYIYLARLHPKRIELPAWLPSRSQRYPDFY